MAKKRATTDLSFVIGIDKPVGMTSHDVVARCRRLFGERRVGHMGTLDPYATGVLVVCVGPATRLDRYLTGHSKVYEFTVEFGAATDTDDAQGQVIATADVAPQVADPAFAAAQVRALVGVQKQMPPAYSAIKVDGVKSYEAARKGASVALEARDIEVFAAELLACESAGANPVWRVRALVSGGTYVRSIARDLGVACGTCAHAGEIRRVRAGALAVQDCATLAQLEENPASALVDPVKLLGYRYCAIDDAHMALVANGGKLAARDMVLHDPETGAPSAMAPQEGESIAVLHDSKLEAIYTVTGGRIACACRFSQGVVRG